MIIRKPYAFLIKNFKKIHIALLILSLFVGYKLVEVSGFVNEFMKFGTYDLYANPISNYISFGLMLSLLLIAGFSGALILLLIHKNKPWKAYLIPLIEYLILFFVLLVINGFFDNYTKYVETTDLRFSRDLLLIFMLGQAPAIYVFVMRAFGLDVQRFNFNADAEFLELSEEDREEIEISFDIDKNTFKRQYKKLLRHLNYFYLEHKIICTGLFVILIGIIGFNIYEFIFVTNKSYKEGEFYNINGLSIVVNNTYYSKNDYRGELISKKNNFVVVELTVTNHGAPTTLNMNYFHLKNSTEDYTTTNNLYATEFQDLGVTYKNVKELKRNESIKFIIIYKVNKDLNPNNFVLFYQETHNKNILRKYKLKVKNLDKKLTENEYSIGEKLPINIYGMNDEVIFDYYQVADKFTYRTSKCTREKCDNIAKEVVAPEGYNILKLPFVSTTVEAKNMIDFVSKYGIIIYKDRDGYDREVEFENPIDDKYYGKVVYIKVPDDFDAESNFNIEFNVRGNKYLYKLS